MNGQDLYEELKDALDYLGCGFRGMAETEVTLENNSLRLEARGRVCLIKLENASEQ